MKALPRVLRFAALLLCAVLPSFVHGAVMTRGPYLQRASTTNVVVRWRTDVATSSRVQFGTSVTNLSLVKDVSTSVTEHEINVTGLTNDTRYYFTVGAVGTVMTTTNSAQYFLTHPRPGTPKPMRVWVLGDSGTANTNAAAVRDAFYNYNGSKDVNVLMMLGDNAYNSGTDAEYQAAVFDMYSSMLLRSVVWPTVGNHDTAQATSFVDTYPYFSIFSLPTAGESGGVASGTEHYYSFDHGMVHFICLDSMTGGRATNGAMANWLRNDLAANTNQWTVAFWHHPPYSHGSHNSDTEIELIEMRQNFLPILEAGGVDLVLCGHSHAYERTKFINGYYGNSSAWSTNYQVQTGSGRGTGAYTKPAVPGGHPSAYKGAVYCVAGSGGQTSGGTLDHPAMYISLNNLGSMVLDITSNRLDAVFLRETGATNDWFTLRKDPPAQAVNGIWLATAGGSWTNPANWTGGVVATGVSAIADFSAQNLTANTTVTLDGARSIGHLSFGDTTSSHGWTLNPGAGGALTLDVTNGTPTINVSNQSATIAVALAGVDGFTKVGTGLLTLSATSTLSGPVALNAGRMQVNGSLSPTSLTAASGTLEGSGLIRGPVSVASAATLSPGVAGIGTLTISNSLTLAGTAIMEINRTNLASDRVVGLTTVTYGGTLNVSNLGGALAAGDVFTLFASPVYSGAFSTLSLPPLNAGLAWSNGLALNGAIRVYALVTNAPPIAVNDATNTLEDTAVAVAVLANDSDPNGGTLSIQSVTQGAHGSAAISGSTVLYTPAANWNGTDSFTYVVTDGQGASASATATVTVLPVNDSPVWSTNLISLATALVGNPFTATLSGYATDPDGDTLTFTKLSGPAWLNISANGSISGTPWPADLGTNIWTVQVQDPQGATASATVRIAVTNTLILEAELATLSGPTVATTYSGYSGTGYADYAHNNSDYIQWNVSVTATGSYALTFRYALNTGSRPLQVTVNGVVAGTVAFPSTGAWTTWSNTLPLVVTLNPGANTVRATVTGSNGADVDYLAVTSLITNAPMIQITQVTRPKAGVINLAGTGPGSQAYRIFAASNITLNSTGWLPITTGTFVNGTFSFSDSTSNNQRFYKLTSP